MQGPTETQVETVKVEDRFVVLFSLRDEVLLSKVIEYLEENNLTISCLITRPAKGSSVSLEYLMEIDGVPSTDQREQLLESMKTFAKDISQKNYEVPWFPRKIKDIDVFANHVKRANAELKSDHPGFKDEVYRARRKEFENIALNYKQGQIIPEMEYTEDEITTWNTVLENLTKLYPTNACKEFNAIWPYLVRECNYKYGSIPQLQIVSDFIKERTGFTLRPVAGLLSPRDFLAGLAFRVFHSTQYIRHGSKPLYTPEPDVVHELVGHVPLFADPEFADFSQEIGLASLGAPDEWIDKLSTLYWFTIEFGLCKEGDQTKAYGAGLLSSFGELEYCLSSEKPEKLPLDPEVAASTEYPITTYQPKYFVAESFTSARQKLKAFADQIPRPFSVRYNALTQSVDVLKSKDDLMRFGKDLQTEVVSFMNAFNRMQ